MKRSYRSLLWQWARQLVRAPSAVARGPLPAVEPGSVGVTRAGHSTMLIRYHDVAIVTDPMLAKSCGGVPRAEACGIDEADLDDVALALISCRASDHLDRASIAKLPPTATVVVPRGGARELAGLDFDRVLELRAGQGFSHQGIEIATAPGAPDSLLYIIRGDGPSVFYCGSSGPTDAFEEVGDAFAPDVALLPISGYSPRSFRKRHLTPSAALDAFESLRSRVFVPHRYGAFALSYETLEDPLRWLLAATADRDLERYIEVLETGGSQLFVPPRGRAQTEAGARQRPIGHGEIVSGEIERDDTDGQGGNRGLGLGDDFDIDDAGELPNRDESYDLIEVDPELALNDERSTEV